MSAMSRKEASDTTPCAQRPDLFHHRLLEDGASGAPDRRLQRSLQRQAAEVCGPCPIMAQCLYRAVVECDVAGFAGGTTEAQRREIRARLGVHVSPEDLSGLLGVRDRHHPINRAEILRARAAHPDESLRELATRFGCSVSSIKRHLRDHVPGQPVDPPSPRTPHPTLRDVLATFRQVVADAAQGVRAA